MLQRRGDYCLLGHISFEPFLYSTQYTIDTTLRLNTVVETAYHLFTNMLDELSSKKNNKPTYSKHSETEPAPL